MHLEFITMHGHMNVKFYITILSTLFSQGRNSLSITMFTKACYWTLSQMNPVIRHVKFCMVKRRRNHLQTYIKLFLCITNYRACNSTDFWSNLFILALESRRLYTFGQHLIQKLKQGEYVYIKEMYKLIHYLNYIQLTNIC